MDVKFKYIMFSSLILNSFLLINLLWLKPGLLIPEKNQQIEESPKRHIDLKNDDVFQVDLADTGVLEEYYSKLLAQGFSVDQTKPLIFTKLKQRFIDAIEKPDDHFWKHQPLAQLDYMENLSLGYQQIREGLLSIYGSAISEDPSVSDIFYPMSTQYPFLSSTEQVAVQNMQLDMQRYATSIQSQGQSVRHMSSDQSPQKMLANALDEKGVKEYQLRTSPMANKMRQSGVDFSENSFRRAYDILLRLKNAEDSHVVFSARDDLNDLLGNDSGLELWAAIDPTYNLIKHLASRHNINEIQALSAFELILTAKYDVSNAAELKESDPQQMVSSIQQIMMSLQNQLSQLVGEPAASDFMNLTSGRGSLQQSRLNKR